MLWKQQGFLTPTGSKVLNGHLIEKPLEAVLLLSSLAVIKCVRLTLQDRTLFLRTLFLTLADTAAKAAASGPYTPEVVQAANIVVVCVAL